MHSVEISSRVINWFSCESALNMASQKCIICDLVFTADEYFVHVYNLHKGNFHMCEKCKKSWHRKRDLKDHIRKKHPEKFEMGTQTVTSYNDGLWSCVNCGCRENYGNRHNHECPEEEIQTDVQKENGVKPGNIQ